MNTVHATYVGTMSVLLSWKPKHTHCGLTQDGLVLVTCAMITFMVVQNSRLLVTRIDLSLSALGSDRLNTVSRLKGRLRAESAS